VLEASDGEEACSVFESHKDDVSLALLDVLMPRVRGREASERMLRLKPGLKVLFASGYSGETLEAAHGLGDGVNLIRKPYDVDALLARLRELLDSSAS
jgi:DNA-binding response OmpR family regulator